MSRLRDDLIEIRLSRLTADIAAAFDGVSRDDGISLHEAKGIDDRKPIEELRAARQVDIEQKWQDALTMTFWLASPH